MADEPEQAPGWIARRKAQAERIARTVESRRETSTPIGIAYDTYNHDNQSGGSVLAAALAFRIFLFYVPYAFFVIYAFGLGSTAANTDAQDVARSAGMGGLLAQAVGAASTQSTTTRIVVVVLSGYALFLGARGLIKVLRIVHGLVWGVPVGRMRRGTRGALLLVVVLTIAIALSFAIHALDRRFIAGEILALSLYAIVPIGVWLYVSWLLPHPPIDVWTLVPGAIVFGIGVALLHAFTVVYFPHLVSSKSDTYGVIGIALVVLFWAYLIGRLMTVSAVFNAALYNRNQRAEPGVPAPPPTWQSIMARTGGIFGLRREPAENVEAADSKDSEFQKFA